MIRCLFFFLALEYFYSSMDQLTFYQLLYNEKTEMKLNIHLYSGIFGYLDQQER